MKEEHNKASRIKKKCLLKILHNFHTADKKNTTSTTNTNKTVFYLILKKMSNKLRKNTVTTRREVNNFDSKVRKNHRGGVLITPEEIKLAFDFLDCDKTGKVSLANLKKRLGVFFPDMSAKEYRFMMNNKREMTIQDFNDMLLENEVTNFDPVAEAFKV